MQRWHIMSQPAWYDIANRTSRDMPLNGPGIIAAAGGNPYESNSFARDSVAALIKRGLMTGSIQDGRNEWVNDDEVVSSRPRILAIRRAHPSAHEIHGRRTRFPSRPPGP